MFLVIMRQLCFHESTKHLNIQTMRTAEVEAIVLRVRDAITQDFYL